MGSIAENTKPLHCFSHSAHWLPTRKKLLYTVANPARGLLNREKKKKKKSGSRPGAASVVELEGYPIMASSPSGTPDFDHYSSFNVEKNQRDLKSKWKAESHKQKRHGFPSTTNTYFPRPPLYLRRADAAMRSLTVVRFLPLVHASAENGKVPFHAERRGWLHQYDILRNIVPVRKPVGVCLCFGGLFQNEAHLGHIFTSSRPPPPWHVFR